MKARHTYHVAYKMHSADTQHSIDVVASSMADAYSVAYFERIPQIEDGDYAYSAWVESVTYQNGNSRYFKTCEGLAHY